MTILRPQNSQTALLAQASQFLFEKSFTKMGIPYSKQINAAFDQVTPLVASAYEVLETTKNIAILLAFIQVFVAILLFFILAALIGLLFTMNPDLEMERRALVTPVMQWLASWVLEPSGKRRSFIIVILLLLAIVVAVICGAIYYPRIIQEESQEDDEVVEDGGSKDGSTRKGKDIDAIKRGDVKQ